MSHSLYFSNNSEKSQYVLFRKTASKKYSRKKRIHCRKRRSIIITRLLGQKFAINNDISNTLVNSLNGTTSSTVKKYTHF